MRVTLDEETGRRTAYLSVELGVKDTIRFDFAITEEVFSKILRGNAENEYKSEVRSRMVTEVYGLLQRVVTTNLLPKFYDEWMALKEVFPVPLPEEEPEKKKKPKMVRCSRQLSAEELEELRAKLLADLEEMTKI